MTTYYAFKLADATQQGIDELLKNLDAGSSAPQHELHTRVSVETSDEILKHSVEELMQRFQSGAEGAGILSSLLGILKSTSHVLVRQLLGKQDNKEVAKMVQYLRSRRVVLKGEVLFGFEMPAELAQRLKTIFAAIAAGDGVAQKAGLTAAMLSFTDVAVAHFYDDFTAPMELGFIKRKASDIGRSTISKGLHVAMNRLIPQLGQKDLVVFAGFFDALFIDA
ncbi:MAG: hypothetical protein PSX71_13595 [bacterium]|nr:hypothetical protein [bacterium]